MTEYPDDCIQYFVDDWWVDDSTRSLQPGRLLKAFVAYPEPTPYLLTAQGRTDPRDHNTANVRIAAHPISTPLPRQDDALPVAALPTNSGEALFVVRGKVRPVIVLATGGIDVERGIAGRAARWQTQRTTLVAPYYGVTSDGTRGGWREEFVSRIRRVEYPQYSWDILPISHGGGGSVLRLDHAFSLSQHQDAYRFENYRLSDEALAYVRQWLLWLLMGDLNEESLGYLRRELGQLDDP